MMRNQNQNARNSNVGPMEKYHAGLKGQRALLGNLAAPLYEVAKMRHAVRVIQTMIRNRQPAVASPDETSRLADLKAGEKTHLQIFWRRLEKAVGDGPADEKQKRQRKLLRLLTSFMAEGLLCEPAAPESCERIYSFPGILVALAQQCEEKAEESPKALANDLRDCAREARARFRDVKRFADRGIMRLAQTVPGAVMETLGRYGYLWGWLRMVKVIIPALQEKAGDDSLSADVQNELRSVVAILDRPGSGITAVPPKLQKMWEEEVAVNPAVAAPPEGGALEVYLDDQALLTEGETAAEEPPAAEMVPDTTDKPADAETVETLATSPAEAAG